MKLSARLAAGALATVAMTVGITAAMTTTADAALIDSLDGDNWTAHNKLDRVAYPGMFIDFDGDFAEGMIGNMCTLGAVGTDSAGRKVGITAGHCNPQTFRPTVHEGVTHPNAPKFLGAPLAVVVTTSLNPASVRRSATASRAESPKTSSGGTTPAVLKRIVDSGQPDPSLETVIINTGTGLKTLDAVSDRVGPAATIDPSYAAFTATGLAD